MGRDVPGPDHHREHPQPVHDRLSADDRDPATARLVELHDHARARRTSKARSAGHIEQYLATDTISARDRVSLFRLAWDVAGSSFGSRQVLYERFFASDPLTRARALAAMYPKNEAMERVLDFLKRDDMEDMR